MMEVGGMDSTIDYDALDGLIDIGRLNEWIATQALPGDGPITSAVKLQGGSQNNIFLLRRGGAEMVLRRPPRHLRDNSNATMLREARVLGALAGTDVPHPELYGSCADVDVIGATFYLMAPIDGFTPTGTLPGTYAQERQWRRSIAEEMVAAAAKLAKVNYPGRGLDDFGKPANWLERQVGRWRSQLEGYLQLEGYGQVGIPNVETVGKWLDDNRPHECPIGIVHGDFQFANVMFAKERPHLAAVVDWELCSLGDPLLDMAWMLTAFVEPGDPPGRDPAFQPPDGLPTRQELARLYGDLTGRDMSVFPWYFILACYKLGIILEGSYARAAAGLADNKWEIGSTRSPSGSSKRQPKGFGTLSRCASPHVHDPSVWRSLPGPGGPPDPVAPEQASARRWLLHERARHLRGRRRGRHCRSLRRGSRGSELREYRHGPRCDQDCAGDNRFDDRRPRSIDVSLEDWTGAGTSGCDGTGNGAAGDRPHQLSDGSRSRRC